MEICRRLIFLIAVCLLAHIVQAQKQLVLLKKEKVVLRLNPGDEFIFSLKGNKGIQRSYINNLFDTALMAHKTIVPFHKIDKIYFNQFNLRNLIGRFLIVAGIGYFVIDQFNVIVVNGDKASLNENVTTASVAMVGVGLPLLLIRKKYCRVGVKYKLLTVEERSPFYSAPITPYSDQ